MAWIWCKWRFIHCSAVEITPVSRGCSEKVRARGRAGERERERDRQSERASERAREAMLHASNPRKPALSLHTPVSLYTLFYAIIVTFRYDTPSGRPKSDSPKVKNTQYSRCLATRAFTTACCDSCVFPAARVWSSCTRYAM